MTLLNAPEFNERKETRNRNLLVGSAIFVALMAVLTVSGYVLGHGWLFLNLPAEHRVKVFLSTLEQGNYAKAYGIWNNDANWEQHPQKYSDYPLKRFTEDWTTASDWHGPVSNFHVDVSKRNAGGTVIAARVNGDHKVFLYYNRSDGTLSFFPYILQY
jgi:hypothetical protein